jgi:diguanylate cyclase (GGDEF)-like protein/PAS domain S-box-containing protein
MSVLDESKVDVASAGAWPPTVDSMSAEREAERLAALERLAILDTEPEEAYDDLVMLASEICGTPIALVSLVGRDRQWFKALEGFDIRETSRDVAFCAHAIVRPDGPMVVPDATRDPRFADNPLVTGDLAIRFYAGAPIVTDDGHALGTVCVIDTRPRTLTASQLRCLNALARQAAVLIGLRERSQTAAQIALEQAGMTAQARLEHEKGAELLELVLQGRDLGLWELDVSKGRWVASVHELALLGYADVPHEVADVDWRTLVHPDDREIAVSSMAPHLRGEAPYHECTLRLRHRDGHWLWMLSRAVVVERDAAGSPLRIVGTHLDVTERRRVEAERQQLADRLDIALVGGDIGIWDVHLATGKVIYNPHWATMLGYTVDEVDAAPDLWRTALHPDDYETFVSRLSAHSPGELTMIEAEGRLRHKDGHWVWVLLRAKVFERDEAGRALRVVGVNIDITARKQSDGALERARQLLEETGRLAQVGGGWEIDLVAETVTWSREVHRIHEVDPGYEPTLASAIAFYEEEARPTITAAVDAAIAGGGAWDLELPMITARGRRIWVRAIGRAEYDDGRLVRLIGALQDITERKAAEDAVARSERRLRGITDNLPACIAEFDREGRFGFANATYRTWFGVDPGATIGKSIEEVFGAAYFAERRQQVERALLGENVRFEHSVPSSNGSRMLHSIYLPHFDEEHRVGGFYALTSDITELKETQRKLQQLARADSLTGLPNRRHFEERASEMLARARRSGRIGALLYLDVDHFKSINDTLGHACGDDLLREFALRLTSSLRETDFVARYAGDEFVALTEGVNDASDAILVATKIAVAIRAPFSLPDVSLFVTTSIGVAVFDGHESLAGLLACADGALYDAKAAGRDTVALEH